MRNDEAPQQYVVPWAQDGQRREVIDDTPAGSNRASWKKGFPSKTMIPLAQGGMPPDGKDINGALYDLSQAVIWFYSGARYPFSQSYADSINGYPQGAWIASSDHSGIWMSMLNENKQDPESGNTGQWLPVHFRGHTEFTQLRGGEYTLREIEAARRIILLRGTLDADLTLVVPTWDTNYSIINEMSGGHDVYVKTSQSSKSLRLGVQSSRFVYCDGKECYREGSEGISLQDVRDQIKASELGGVMRTQTVNGHPLNMSETTITSQDIFSTSVRIGSGADMNSITSPGLYHVGSSDDSNTIANLPAGANAGALTVVRGGDGVVNQQWSNYIDGQTWHRGNPAGKWGNWSMVYSSDHKPTPNELGAVPEVRQVNGHPLTSDVVVTSHDTMNQVVGIAQGASLNDIRDTGLYVLWSGDWASGLRDAPVGVQAGTLCVRHSAAGRIQQTWTNYTDGQTWHRGDVGTPWAMVYDTNHKPTPSDVGAVPNNRHVNGYSLDADVNLGPSDIMSRVGSLGPVSLNTIKSAGLYVQYSQADASADRAYPEQSVGSLRVYAAGNPDLRIQEYAAAGSGILYRRVYLGYDAWSQWSAVYSTLNKPQVSDLPGTLAVNHGGTGSTSPDGARSNLGLGSMATQNKDGVDITGGNIKAGTIVSTGNGATYRLINGTSATAYGSFWRMDPYSLHLCLTGAGDSMGNYRDKGIPISIILSDGTIKLNNSTEIYGGLELYNGGGTPFIDFHFGGNTGDYTSRIIETASGKLSIYGEMSWTKPRQTLDNLGFDVNKQGKGHQQIGTDGIIIQWGSWTSPARGAGQWVGFDKSFPSGCMGVVVGVANAASQMSGCKNYNNGGFIAATGNEDPLARSGWYIAIGW